MKRGALTVLLLCILPTRALADVVFLCPGGSWSNAKCWYVLGTSPAQFRLPNPGETVYITGIQSTVTLDISASPGLLYIDSVPKSSGVFSQPGDSLQAATENLGPFGAFTQTGGTNGVAGALVVEATYNLQDGSLTAQTESIVSVPVGTAVNSAATFNQNGTNANTVSGTLGLATGPPSFIKSSGTYNLSGGALSAVDEVVGESGVGTFKQDGGTNRVRHDLDVGKLPGSIGVYTLNKGGSLDVRVDEVIGNSGSGSFLQNGGAHTVDFLEIGGLEGGDGSFSLSSGNLTARNETIGQFGNGHFLQSGGNHTVENQLAVYDLLAGTAEYTLESTGILEVKGHEEIGVGGNGTFTQSGLTQHIVASTLYIGSSAGHLAVYNLNGGVLKASALINSGLFNFSGGLLQANVENDQVFDVHGPAFRLIVGNFINNDRLTCGIGAVLGITGTYVNHGTDTNCHIIHINPLSNP